MRKELNILIIEDVPRDAEAVEEELRSEGLHFNSTRVETKEDFLKALQTFSPDIVLSDFTLPDWNALDALHLLQAHDYDIPFILVTGTRSEEVAVECIKEGADDYILKASLKRLPSSILNALKKKAAEREQARAEAALRHNEEQFRLITEKTRDLIGLLDLEGRFIYASPSFKAALGYQPEELAGTDAFAMVHPEDRETLRQTWQQALSNRDARTAECRVQHQNGQWRIFESVSNWVFDEQGHPQRSVIVSRDISQRKQAEETLRALPRLIREAQEAERHRVARELHDSVIQILSSVKFRIQSVEEKLLDRDEPAWREALKAKALLERAIQEVRRISRNLRPSELDDLGLVPAVRSFCEEFRERTNIDINLSFSRLPESFPSELELNLYRIIQEALTNVEKHARATQLHLQLSLERSIIQVQIRDNGRGFDSHSPRSQITKAPGMGLMDMKERAAFVGGTWSIKSAPKEGTEILVRIPLHSQPKNAEKRKTEKDKIAAGG